MTIPNTLLSGLGALLPDLVSLYKDLHAHPELSFQEHRTAAVVAERLRAQGWDVTEGVGRTGVVGVLRSGDGPTVLLRADMDALPVKEETGLPYASTARAVTDDGREVPVMHACGHDVHVTALLGTCALLAADRDAWRGTVVAVFQPAEEVGGAPVMLEDGFAERFPRPDVCLGQHTAPVPVGYAGSRPGTIMSSSDSLRVVLKGRGGHGSAPEGTVDPVVLAAAVVLRLQTVVSREVAAADMAVVTVGSLHAGTKENIIPDTAELKINIRADSPDVRRRVMDAVERIVRLESAVSGAAEPEIDHFQSYPLTHNDPEATARTSDVLAEAMGGRFLTLPRPLTGSEDFGQFGQALGVPSVFWFFGTTDPALFTQFDPSRLSSPPTGVPGSHSGHFAPLAEPSVETGVRLMTTAAAHWLGTPGV
ncbi:amidohydrolase [Streptomyces parvulus]|uniref:amidohydrolase n=1 Tax=Streptomyces parvulus TaxID=146923 RepID=UPI001E2E09C5|nr:amidohydrolase [Streptomyces parvulus]MCC9157058.1 amidohydrolase [Streptomyces parvulus]MCE7688622.1 amidohydrolase [Streptomyces parvulus]